MRKIQDLQGLRFGSWTVTRYAGKRGARAFWECACDCGVIRSIDATSLRTGHSKSCGCTKRDACRVAALEHGLHYTRSRQSWVNMMARCYNPASNRYHAYGARGIVVCDRWHDLVAFVEDMGERPSGHTLERIDNDGPYCKDNCRWATYREQANNKSNNTRVTAHGVTKTVAEWSRDTGITCGAIYARLASGWTPERAVTEQMKRDSRRREAA